MAIPDFQSFFYPFLKLSSDRQEHSLKDVREYMTNFFSLTEEDKSEKVPSGTQTKFDFVPEQSTDFIFCTVGEEWGFVGSTFVISLFGLLLLRLIFIAERQKSKFTRIYAYGVVSIFFFHIAVNVGMTIGIAPVIGIPLPFFSYGGSSLWSFTILLFILLKLDSDRDELLF